MAANKTVDRSKAGIRDVAEAFGVNERTVRRWMQTTDIPYRRIEGTILFNLDEVDDWSSRGSRPSQDEPAA